MVKRKQCGDPRSFTLQLNFKSQAPGQVYAHHTRHLATKRKCLAPAGEHINADDNWDCLTFWDTLLDIFLIWHSSDLKAEEVNNLWSVTALCVWHASLGNPSSFLYGSFLNSQSDFVFLFLMTRQMLTGFRSDRATHTSQSRRIIWILNRSPWWVVILKWQNDETVSN